MSKRATATALRGTLDLAISEIVTPFYVRQHLDDDRVLYLAELVENGIELDPITVYPLGDGYGVRDGRHRIKVAEFFNKKSIKATIVPPAKDEAEEIALAYKANTGGALPPTRQDTEHTIQLLLSKGVAGKDIAKLIPVPPSLARRYVNDVISKLARIRMRHAMDAVAEGSLNAKQSAEKFNVDFDQLRKNLGGKKKKQGSITNETKQNISKRYRSVARTNAHDLKVLLEKFLDGDITSADFEDVLKLLTELNRKATVNVKNWRERMKQVKETTSNIVKNKGLNERG